MISNSSNVRSILAAFPPKLDSHSANITVSVENWDLANISQNSYSKAVRIGDVSVRSKILTDSSKICQTTNLIEKLQKEVEHWKNMYFIACDELERCRKNNFGLCPPKLEALPTPDSYVRTASGFHDSQSSADDALKSYSKPPGNIACNSQETIEEGYSSKHLSSNVYTSNVRKADTRLCIIQHSPAEFVQTTNFKSGCHSQQRISKLAKHSEFASKNKCAHVEYKIEPPASVVKSKRYASGTSLRYHVMSFPDQYRFQILSSAGAASFVSAAMDLPAIPDKSAIGILFLFRLHNRDGVLSSNKITGGTQIIETDRYFCWGKESHLSFEIEAVKKKGAIIPIKLQSMRPNNKDLTSDRYRHDRSLFVYESYRSDERKQPTVKTSIGVYETHNQYHLVFIKLRIEMRSRC